jgi:hypothetical protein
VSTTVEGATAIRSSKWSFRMRYSRTSGARFPAAVTVFPRERYRAPRSWTEQAYPNLVYAKEVGEGNHFVAWRGPGIFTNELRAAFRTLR